MEKLKQIKKSELLLLIFIFLNPILDILNFYNIKLSIVLRSIYVLAILLYLLMNKYYIKYLIFLLLFSVVYFIHQKFYLNIPFMLSLSSVFKYLYLIFTIMFFKSYELSVDKRKVLTIAIFSYLLIFLLSYITKIGADEYSLLDLKRGYKGVFNSPNEISAIIGMLMIYVTYYLFSIKKYFSLIILYILSIIFCFVVGTKVMLGMIVLSILYIIYKSKDKLFSKKHKKRNLIILFISFVIFIILFIKSNVFYNLNVQRKFFNVEKIFSLEFINVVLFNKRFTFLSQNYHYFMKKNLFIKLFGLGFLDETVKLVEIDMFDILFRYGIIGFINYFVILFLILPYKKLNLEEKLTILMFFLISLTSGHVLIYPSVCIYAGVVINKNKIDSKTK